MLSLPHPLTSSTFIPHFHCQSTCPPLIKIDISELLVPKSCCYTWNRFTFTESRPLGPVTHFLFFHLFFPLLCLLLPFLHFISCVLLCILYFRKNKRELLTAALSSDVFIRISKQLGPETCCFTWQMVSYPIQTVVCPSHDFVHTARTSGPGGLFIAQRGN